jgi:hypothetical protein
MLLAATTGRCCCLTLAMPVSNGFRLHVCSLLAVAHLAVESPTYSLEQALERSALSTATLWKKQIFSGKCCFVRPMLIQLAQKRLPLPSGFGQSIHVSILNRSSMTFVLPTLL